MSSNIISLLKSNARYAVPLFLSTISLSVYAVDITPESMVGTGSCTATGHDGACWQEAINAAHNATTNKFGNVAGLSGKQYLIDDTIIVCNGTEGVIDGHGAQLHWIGAPGKPMFLVVGSNHMRFANLMVKSTSSLPLESAFEFASTLTSPYSSPICQGPVWPSSKNSLDHVTAEGTNNNGLNYGVRFSNRYLINNGDGINNDMSTIIDSNFYNVTKTAISIEHTQSGQHRFISVNGYGVQDGSGNPNNTTSCFVDSTGGSFASTGGFQAFWGKANFCFLSIHGTAEINESNSENSRRLLAVGDIGDNTGYHVSVNITGGRFAVNKLASDGRLIDFNRLGPLNIRGLRIDGSAPTGVAPFISIQPGQIPHTPAVAASASIQGVTFGTTSSDTLNPLTVKTFVTLDYSNSLCADSALYSVPCPAAVRN